MPKYSDSGLPRGYAPVLFTSVEDGDDQYHRHWDDGEGHDADERHLQVDCVVNYSDDH